MKFPKHWSTLGLHLKACYMKTPILKSNYKTITFFMHFFVQSTQNSITGTPQASHEMNILKRCSTYSL
jgi:hypothetical protein